MIAVIVAKSTNGRARLTAERTYVLVGRSPTIPDGRSGCKPTVDFSCVRICVDVRTSVLRLQEENRGKFKCNTTDQNVS